MRRIAANLALVAALAVAAPATARPIERYTMSSPSGAPPIILQGVSVPAGADMIFLSGQIASPVDPSKKPGPGMTMADYGDTRTQAISALTKIKQALESHGYTMKDVIKLTIFAAGDPKLGGKMDFEGINAGYKTFFGTPDNPNLVARSTVQVAALAGPAFLVEIEATAARAK